MKMHVTIVDDLKENLDTYEDLLSDSFNLELIQNPLNLIPYLNLNNTDLVLLDLHMPIINGIDLFNKLKIDYSKIPVIFLSGDSSEESVIKGLELGAADFIVKPVSIKELEARITNKIKNFSYVSTDSSILRIKNLTLMVDGLSATLDNEKLNLTPIEFQILHTFAKRPKTILSRQKLNDLIWPEIHVQNQNIDTHLSNLRKKMGSFAKHLKTIKNKGYILEI